MHVAKQLAYLLAMVSASLAAASHAQVPAPPVIQNLDDNGVNRSSGKIHYSVTDISIGPADHRGLAYTRHWTGDAWVNSFVMTMSGSDAEPIVSVGGSSEAFTQSTSDTLVYSSKLGRSGKLEKLASGSYIYTSRDGVKYNFVPSEGVAYIPYEANVARIDSIAYPDGTRVNFYYKVVEWSGNQTAQLMSVTNSYGYQLRMEYHATAPAVTKVTAINSTVDYCDPMAATCSFTRSWPHADYTYEIQRGFPPERVSDPAGQVTYYTYVISPSATTGLAVPFLSTISRTGANGKILNVTYADLSGHGPVVTSVKNEVWTEDYSYALYQDQLIIDKTSAARLTTIALRATGAIIYADNGVIQTASPIATGPNAGLYQYVEYPKKTLQYTYDERGNVVKFEQGSRYSGGGQPIVVFATYPSTCVNVVTCNKPLTTADAKGNVTEYSYDPVHGGILSVKGPAASAGGARPETRTTYATLKAYYKTTATGSPVASVEDHYLPVGTSTCMTSANCTNTADEVRTGVGYGPQQAGVGNNLLPVIVSNGSGDGALTAAITTSYDSIGNPTYIDGPLGGSADTTRAIYDANRQTIGMIGPDPDGIGPRKNRARRITLGVDGLPYKEEEGVTAGLADSNWAAFEPVRQIERQFDEFGKINRETSSASGVAYAMTDYYVSGAGRCTAIRMNLNDPGLYESTSNSSSRACRAGAVGPYGPDRITVDQRDQSGRVDLLWTAYGTGDDARENTTYDPDDGNVTKLIDGRGNTTFYKYDIFGRLTRTSYLPPQQSNFQEPSSTDYVEYTYDANGNVTRERLRDGQTIGFTYDNLNRKVAEDRSGVAIDQDRTFTYDLLGRLLTSSDATGHTVSYVYDALGRVTSQSSTYGGAILSEYDLAGRRTKLTWSDGFYVSYDHLVTGEVSAIRENGASSGAGVLATYAYDDFGRRTSLTRGNGTVTTYGRDAMSRLTALGHDFAGSAQDVTTTFSYNPASQILSSTRDNDAYAWTGHYNIDRSYTVNRLNQVATAGTAAGSTSFGYDGRGNLTSSGADSFAYGQRNQLYAKGAFSLSYDPAGRLDRTQDGSAVTTYAYDGSNLIAEYDLASGAMTGRYVHGPGTDDPLVWYDGAGTGNRRWLYPDERGSIVALANAAGTVTGINTYDEYGIPGAGNVGRFQYTGQTWLPGLGLYYYKARMYSPTLGRFMQRDPSGYNDGMNMYAYVKGDPVNGVDPSGNERVMMDNQDSWGTMARLGGDEWEYDSGFIDSTGGGRDYTFGWLSDGGGHVWQNQVNRQNENISSIINWGSAKGINFSVDDSLEIISQIRDNQAKGKKGEEQARYILNTNGYTILGEQVFVKTSAGLRITDFISSINGVISGWEAKTGIFAQRSSLQKLKDEIIANQGGTIISRGLSDRRLRYGSIIKYPTGVISILDLQGFK